MHFRRSGFTLIELLIVIAIVAILAIVVVLVLNPAQLLMQARDSNRFSDLATINSALGYYLQDQASPSLGNASTSYISIPDSTATSTAGDQCQGLNISSLGSASWHCAQASSSRTVNAAGWLPVNLSAISVGSPLGQLPVDPVNQTSTDLFYSYGTNGTQYEISAALESNKYKTQFATSPQMPNYPEVAAIGSNLLVSSLWNVSGLIGYWPLDQTTGSSAADQSGNGNTGTLVSSPAWISGKIGNAIQFNGGNYVSTSLTWPSSGTIALWAEPTSYNNWDSPAGWKYAPSTGGYILIDEGGAGGTGNWRAVFNPGGTTESDIVSGAILENQWSQVTMTWSASGTTYTTALYVNGLQIGTTTWTGTPSASIGPFYFGTAGQSANNDYAGNVDDLRVYSRALSVGEVQALYNAQK